MILVSDKMIEEGKTYLFATRYLDEEKWHTLIPVGGDIPINREAEKEELIKKYTEAHKKKFHLN